MVLPNPFYIDAEARHYASVLRVQAHAAVNGAQGALLADALKVVALSTPGNSIMVGPGPYAVTARHTGGEFESYVGKVPVAEQSPPISPVGSSGARTDLVILRVENPFVPEATSWAEPPDPLNGPYVHIRVIEGVNPAISSVTQHNNTWSAITLARITRPANTGVIMPEHIVDLRNPASAPPPDENQETPPDETEPPDEPGEPVPPPPVAHEDWIRTLLCQIFNQVDDTFKGVFKNWPFDANWKIPVPTWAQSAEVTCTLTPQAIADGALGQLRLKFGEQFTPTVTYDELKGNTTCIVSGTIPITADMRGKTITALLQAKKDAAAATGANLKATQSTAAQLQVKFRRTAR